LVKNDEISAFRQNFWQNVREALDMSHPVPIRRTWFDASTNPVRRLNPSQRMHTMTVSMTSLAPAAPAPRRTVVLAAVAMFAALAACALLAFGGAGSVLATVSWGTVSWGTVSWGTVSWGTVSWGTVSWGALSELATVSWGAVAHLATVSWGTVSWGTVSWGTVSWG
jgi:hypothetical protein